jgi:DNA primase
LLERRLADLINRIADATVRGHYQQEIRARLAKAWADAGMTNGHRWSGELARFGTSAQGRPRATGGRHSGLRSAFTRSAGPGHRTTTPSVFAGASAGLLSSSLAQGGSLALPSRETLILRTILNHPWLIDQEWECIAALSFTATPLQRLRDGILEVHASNNPLDRTTLQTQLTRSGLDKVVDLVERAATHKSDKFAEPDADMAQVEIGWRDAISLHEKQVGLRHALEAAEKVWHQDGDAEAFARICDIRQQLDAAEAVEIVHD